MTTKEKFDELNRYFIDKLINDEYEDASVGIHVATFRVKDEQEYEYVFHFWYANGFYQLHCDGHLGSSSMNLQLSEDEKRFLYRRIHELRTSKTDKEEKKMHYEQLKRELGYDE